MSSGTDEYIVFILQYSKDKRIKINIYFKLSYWYHCFEFSPLNSAYKIPIHMLSRFLIIFIPLSNSFSIAATSMSLKECPGSLKCITTTLFDLVLTDVLCSGNLIFNSRWLTNTDLLTPRFVAKYAIHNVFTITVYITLLLSGYLNSLPCLTSRYFTTLYSN